MTGRLLSHDRRAEEDGHRRDLREERESDASGAGWRGARACVRASVRVHVCACVRATGVRTGGV
eukprot:6196791-Pleurochrysis_carterae.AAC.1